MPVPTQVSNRAFIEKMRVWGWSIHRDRGDTITMKHLISGELVDVFAPHIHKGNSAKTIAAVYRLTTSGNSERFWDGPDTATVTDRDIALADFDAEEAAMVVAVQDQVLASKTDPKRRRKVRQYIEQLNSEPTPEPEKTDDNESEPEEVKPEEVMTSTANTGLARRALELLVSQNKKPTTVQEAAIALGVSETAASNTLSYLRNKGQAVRILRGTYIASPSLLPNTTVAHEVSGVATGERTLRVVVGTDHPSAHRPATSPLVDETAPTATPAPPAPESTPDAPTDDIDATIEAVLDLMFPMGFKARHLGAITEWQRATRELIRTVTS